MEVAAGAESEKTLEKQQQPEESKSQVVGHEQTGPAPNEAAAL